MDRISTERLLLRPLVREDRDALIDFLSRWDVVRNLARWKHPLDPQMVDDLLARHETADPGGYGIDLDGTVIGLIGSSASVGFMLHPEYWGQGYMSEALKAVQTCGLNERGYEAMTGNVLVDNVASARVFEKCGWREVAGSTCFSAARDAEIEDRVFVLSKRYDWLDPIETERLVLRPLGPEDFDAIWPIVTDQAIVRMLMSWPWPADKEYTEKRLADAQARSGLVSAIVMDGQTVGMIGCTKGSLWYALHPSVWGKGVGTEAARGKIGRAFDDPSVNRLIAGTWDDNPASAAILTKLGFVQTGHDTIYHEARGEDASGPDFELTRANWEALH